MRFEDVDALEAALAEESYLADRGLAVSVYLALTLRRPLLLEGEPGVGKTEVARTLARVLGAELIRLQCYEGIDAGQALYEWDYSRQLLYARTIQDGQLDPSRRAAELYGPEFLVERPLLRAVRAGAGAVLLVDELDRADEEFEAFLLEVLADSAVTIPEIGTVTAEQPPVVVLTSNRTRELHDALKRRCLYHWIDYPTLEREMAIIRLRAPEASEALARSVAEVVARLREMDLIKRPGPAEAIDWAARSRPSASGRSMPRRPTRPWAGWSRTATTSRWCAGRCRSCSRGERSRDPPRPRARAARGGRAGGHRADPELRAGRRVAGPGRPLLGRARDAHLAPRGHPGVRPGLRGRLRHRRRPGARRRQQVAGRIPSVIAPSDLSVTAGAARGGRRDEPRQLGRGPAAQELRGLHRGRAGDAGAPDGAPAAARARAAHAPARGRRARATPTCGARCGAPCAPGASRSSAPGGAGGCSGGGCCWCWTSPARCRPTRAPSRCSPTRPCARGPTGRRSPSAPGSRA